MPDVPGSGDAPHPHLPPTAGLGRTAAEAALEPESPAAHRAGWGFISLYTLAPSIAVVLVGWCLAQLFFNALLAAVVAVLPDQVPAA
jgi:hypothetical protein